MVELEVIKSYIETNLVSFSINSSKFFASELILFISKKYNSFYFYMDYKNFNNLTLKNCYLLF